MAIGQMLPAFRGHNSCLTLVLLLSSSGSLAQSIALDLPMDESLARAMLGRFGYGPTVDSIARVTGMTPRAYLEQGIRGASALPGEVSEKIKTFPSSQAVASMWKAYGPGGSEREAMNKGSRVREDFQRDERILVRSAIESRLLAMANSDNQAHEALLGFWLNHFSIFAPKNVVKILAADYGRQMEAAMRADSFEALLRASFFHPAMQIYLDNAQSTSPDSQAARFAAEKGRNLGINENLARELMELHTLGVDGGYTQKDVQELARIITGAGVWVPRMNDQALERAHAVRMGLFLFDPRRHDFAPKRLLGEEFPAGHGLDEIDRALHLLATSRATARHVSRKMALRFLSDSPSDTVLDAMTNAFLQSGGKVSATLEAMVVSTDFATSLESKQKFKEPLDQLLSAARAACQAQPVGNSQFLTAAALDSGEAPFMRTTPDGYGAREADWLSPAAMAKRIRLAMGIAAGRAPLAAPATEDPSGRVDAMGPQEKPRFMRGFPCQLNPRAIETTLGPISPTTHAALLDLAPNERVAALLASPEALHR